MHSTWWLWATLWACRPVFCFCFLSSFLKITDLRCELLDLLFLANVSLRRGMLWLCGYWLNHTQPPPPPSPSTPPVATLRNPQFDPLVHKFALHFVPSHWCHTTIVELKGCHDSLHIDLTQPLTGLIRTGSVRKRAKGCSTRPRGVKLALALAPVIPTNCQGKQSLVLSLPASLPPPPLYSLD